MFGWKEKVCLLLHVDFLWGLDKDENQRSLVDVEFQIKKSTIIRWKGERLKPYICWKLQKKPHICLDLSPCQLICHIACTHL